MHNKSVQNVQNYLECVGGYQGKMNLEGKKKKITKDYILISFKPKFLLVILIEIQDSRIYADLGKLLCGNLVTQTCSLPLSCMKPKPRNLCRWLSELEYSSSRVEENNWKMFGRYLGWSLHASLVSGGLCCRCQSGHSPSLALGLYHLSCLCRPVLAKPSSLWKHIH